MGPSVPVFLGTVLTLSPRTRGAQREVFGPVTTAEDAIGRLISSIGHAVATR
jgi:hypothetical protein